MCGRFSLHLTDLSLLADALGVTRSGIEVWEPRFNVAPTQLAPVVVDTSGERVLTLARFGLVPHWAEDPAIGARLINARIETVADKPAFRDAFKSHRCIVPVTGYYEWQRTGTGGKQPTWLHPKPGEAPVLYLAGLWARWRTQTPTPTAPAGADQGQREIESFCILTRPATGVAEAVHDRMPVALTAELAQAWMASDGPRELLNVVLEASAETSGLLATPVSTAVSSPRNDSRACIEEVQPASTGQLDLF